MSEVQYINFNLDYTPFENNFNTFVHKGKFSFEHGIESDKLIENV